MGKTLVTGGTGFLGSHIVRALAKRGDDVRLLVRRTASMDNLEGVEFERTTGSVGDRRAIRRAMKGTERVFHVAGVTSLRPSDRELVFEVNVGGTRNVLEEALKADVERVVHTSSVAAVGPAKAGGTADEDQIFTAGELGIAYVNSKHEAEAEAMRLAAHGLPVVCVNPSFVFGPGDIYGSSTALVRRFLLGRIPAYVEGGLNVVDVRDVARGHLQADRKGEVGERYILAGRNFTLDRLFSDLGRVSGVSPPALKIPAGMVLAGVETIERLGVPVPMPVTRDELRSAGLWWTYRNTKAKRELGFKARPHEETIEETVDWHLERIGSRVARGPRRQDIPLRALARVLGLGSRLR
jgi:dihydroflavonol-4-reductase